MAASLLIEHDHGTYSGAVRSKHQGYYAGDFRTQPNDGKGFEAQKNPVHIAGRSLDLRSTRRS